MGRDRYEVGAEYRVAESGEVGPRDREDYLAALVRLAAIDGVTEPEELVIAEAAAGLGLDRAAVEDARRRAADRTVQTESLVSGVRDPGLRVCLLRDAYRLAAADGQVTLAEMGELARLASVLGVAPVEVAGRPHAEPPPRPSPAFREAPSSGDGCCTSGPIGSRLPSARPPTSTRWLRRRARWPSWGARWWTPASPRRR